MKYNQPYGVSDPNAPYVNGNPTTGTMGSIPPAESIEHPQREIVNLITDAGVTPSAADLHQLARGVQGQKLVYAEDFGIANSYLINTVPVIPAYVKGQRWNVKIKTTNTGPSVANINAIGPRAIVLPDGSPLKGNEMVAGAIVGLIDDGTNLQLQGGPGGGGSSGGILTANKDYYVNSTTGSDTLYDGTSPTLIAGTSRGPFKQIQRAVNATLTWTMNNFQVTIHVADGTYDPFVCSTLNGAGTCNIIGNPSSPANCFVHALSGEAIMVFANDYVIRGLKVQSDAMGATPHFGTGIRAFNAYVRIANIDFGYCYHSHMIAQSNGTIIILGVESGESGLFYNVTGDAQYHVLVIQSGFLHFALPDLNVIGTRNIGTWLCVHTQAVVDFHYNNMSGAAGVIGKKYDVSINSVINSVGGGINYFPGSIAGVASTGGQYV